MIEFRYSLYDMVKIRDLDLCGYITGLLYTETGKKYQVEYFYDGEPRTAYLFELQLIDAGKPNSFAFDADKEKI
jgi:hypothetical protein